MDPAVSALPVYTALAALYDNYVASPGEREDHTEQEIQEENAFIQVRSETQLQ